MKDFDNCYEKDPHQPRLIPLVLLHAHPSRFLKYIISSKDYVDKTISGKFIYILYKLLSLINLHSDKTVGRPPILMEEHEKFLHELIDEKPSLVISDIMDEIMSTFS
ncbi:hypothetical protein BDF21DRAFT_405132 [Thamnidium elegans]|nr:hypothetical protein BDF21DRAFT_405132 [Thamnidium elegans]